MAYGAGKFDTLVNSNGATVDLTTVVTTNATTSAAGYMSAADKTKLDAVEVNTSTGDVTLNAQADLRFADSDSSNYVAFQAPTTVASDITWTLPATDGTSGQSLTTDGAGTLQWETPQAGVSLGLVIALS